MDRGLRKLVRCPAAPDQSSVGQTGYGLRRQRAGTTERPTPGWRSRDIERARRHRAFRPALPAGTLLGRVDGLKLGLNVLEAGAGASRAKLSLVNHPIAGPVFSGPHQQPFVCQTEFSGLGKALDADCNAPTRVEYFYKSTERLRPEAARKRQSPAAPAPGYKPLNPSEPLPPDVATTTTTDGKQRKHIVRLETGTINRGIYRIAFLHEPGHPLPDPWTSTAQVGTAAWCIRSGAAPHRISPGTNTAPRGSQRRFPRLRRSRFHPGRAWNQRQRCDQCRNAHAGKGVFHQNLRSARAHHRNRRFGRRHSAIHHRAELSRLARRYHSRLQLSGCGHHLEPILDCAVLGRAFG